MSAWRLGILLLAACSHASSRAPASDSVLYHQGAGAFEIARESRQVFFRSPNCASFQSTLTALAHWRKGEEANCVCADGQCEAEVTALLPEFILSTLGQRAPRANCFNTALIAAGLATEIGFVRFTDFAKRLRSERCHSVGEPVAGDLGVVSQRGGLSPVHAFLFIQEKLGYEKPGSDQQDPWRFMNPARVRATGGPYDPATHDLLYFRCH